MELDTSRSIPLLPVGIPSDSRVEIGPSEAPDYRAFDLRSALGDPREGVSFAVADECGPAVYGKSLSQDL